MAPYQLPSTGGLSGFWTASPATHAQPGTPTIRRDRAAVTAPSDDAPPSPLPSPPYKAIFEDEEYADAMALPKAYKKSPKFQRYVPPSYAPSGFWRKAY